MAPDVTVAVNVTDWPYVDELGREATVVVEINKFTVCFSVAELALNAESPGYPALMAWTFAVSEEVVKVADPPVVVPVPMRLAPS